MTMTTTTARTRIVRELTNAETALNDALLTQSRLFTSMITARRDTDVDQLTGHDALLRLAKSQQALLTSGGDLARLHGQLLEINREIGGTGHDCPDFELELFGASLEVFAA